MKRTCIRHHFCTVTLQTDSSDTPTLSWRGPRNNVYYLRHMWRRRRWLTIGFSWHHSVAESK